MSAARGDYTRLDFTAQIVNGSCEFSLSRSHVALETVLTTDVKASTLLSARPVDLTIHKCTMTGISSPIVRVSGTGKTLDKWTFRSHSSTSQNVGIMMVQTDTPPTYSSKEVVNNQEFPLEEEHGMVKNQTLPFYVGLTCGNATTCADTTGGTVIANITFTLDFL